uniref:PIN domain-containing protein n=1 Tax=Candidatus Kentrum sp. LFY TaxID=2126342 RepID=A0A450U5P5_9GAMM|nr:MAG: hypothetical protein BECKLFY1418B_GA0070995_100337 [Candidatus Kentron sp. LFY]
MRLLLDTHVFPWLRFSPDRVSRNALIAYREPRNEVFLGVAHLPTDDGHGAFAPLPILQD